MIIIPDTSILIEGYISKNFKKLDCDKILVPEAVVAELEHQANKNKTKGYFGLKEIEKLRSLVDVEFKGRRPHASEIEYAKKGEIDNLIREVAHDEDGTLFTSDKVQAEVAKAKGISVEFIKPKHKTSKLEFEKYFDETTMSAHLREKIAPFAKKGKPGEWTQEQLSDKKFKREDIVRMASEIIEECQSRDDAFIEIERSGSSIVQFGHYRIVITRPPFSEGWEITAVRPVKKLSLKDYDLSEKLMTRIAEQAEGILVAGAPGMGKSTFVQGLAEFYDSLNKVVKTVEAPRDLVLPESITQYAISHGSPEEVHDILLLSRPDYTVFDEMRNTEDFKLFADMRLAGVGMVGIVHATNPIDAIQRFIGRVEMGVIPQIIDTVVFIKNGEVAEVLKLAMVVKVPSGMTEADLARPIVVVDNFETNEPAYEIYSYGEQTVVIPVQKNNGEKTGLDALAEAQIRNYFMKYSKAVEVNVISKNRVVVFLPEKAISRVIGKGGKNIEAIEKQLGLSIDVQELSSMGSEKKAIDFEYKISKAFIQFFIDEEFVDKDADLFIEGEYILSAKIGNQGKFKVKKKSAPGKELYKAIQEGDLVEIRI